MATIIYRVYDKVTDEVIPVNYDAFGNAEIDTVLYTVSNDSLRIVTPDITNVKKTVVDFGDGNVISGFDIQHNYKFPGKYVIKIKQFIGINYEESFNTVTVLVKNILEDYITLDFTKFGFINESIGTNDVNVGFLYESITTDVIGVLRQNSFQSINKNNDGTKYKALLYPDINSDEKSLYFDDKNYNKIQYVHLIPTVKFLDVNDNKIDVITFDCTYHYYKKEFINNKVVFSPYYTTKDNIDTAVVLDTIIVKDEFVVLAGTSGSSQFKFVDEAPSAINTEVTVDYRKIKITLDTSNFINYYDDKLDPTDKEVNFYFETSNLSYHILYRVLNVEPTKLSITSNGLITENFEINPIQWHKLEIPFTVNFAKEDSGNTYALKSSKANGLTITPHDDMRILDFDPDTELVDATILNDHYVISARLQTLISSTWTDVDFVDYSAELDTAEMNKIPLAGAYIFGKFKTTFDEIIEAAKLSTVTNNFNTPKFRIIAEGYRKNYSWQNVPNYLFMVHPETNVLYRIFKSFDITLIYNRPLTFPDAYLSNNYITNSIDVGSFGIAYDVEHARIWVSNPVNNIVRCFDSNTGAILKGFDLGGDTSPGHILIDNNGDAYICLVDKGDVIKYTFNTSTVSTIFDSTSIQVDLTDPSLYPNNVYEGSVGQYKIQPVEVQEFNGEVFVLFGNLLYNSIVKLSNSSQIFDANLYINGFKLTYDGACIITHNRNINTQAQTIKTYNATTFVQQQTINYTDEIHNIFQDEFNRIWVVHGTGYVSVYDINTSLGVLTYKITYKIDNFVATYNSNITGITCDKQFVYLLDNYNNKLHAISLTLPLYDSNETYSITNPILLNTSSADYNKYYALDIPQGSYAFGDWSGIEKTLKYNPTFEYPTVYSDTYTKLTGYSNDFNIYDIVNLTEVNLHKINGDFNFYESLKNFCYQPALNDIPNFYEFLLKIYGDGTDLESPVGKLVYERIKNFVANNADVDVSTIRSLYSLAFEVSLSMDAENVSYPYDLTNILDLLSIKLSKLVGTTNKFEHNFGNRLNKGPNLGALITAGLAAGTINVQRNVPIVAFDKFTETFKFLDNNNINTISGGPSTDVLSNFSNQWGWSLIYPVGTTGLDILNYYDFYEYIPAASTEKVENVITDTILDNKTTVEWEKNNGYMELLLQKVLTESIRQV